LPSGLKYWGRKKTKIKRTTEGDVKPWEVSGNEPWQNGQLLTQKKKKKKKKKKMHGREKDWGLTSIPQAIGWGGGWLMFIAEVWCYIPRDCYQFNGTRQKKCRGQTV